MGFFFLREIILTSLYRNLSRYICRANGIRCSHHDKGPATVNSRYTLLKNNIPEFSLVGD